MKALQKTTHTDQTQRLRMKRQWMAVGSYLVFLIPLSYAVHNGWMAFSWMGLAALTALALLANGVFLWLVASGRSANFKDPSMTLAQVVVALGMALVMIRYAEEVRPVFLMLFFSSFFFGIFGFKRREFWGVALGTILAYGIIVGSEFWTEPQGSVRFKIEALQFIALSIILLWMAAIGSYVARMRQTLVEQRRALHSAVNRLHELATVDELTGMPNRRHLMDVMEHEQARCKRNNSQFSLCLLDIDHFKSINDRLGHAAGDAVLVEFGQRLMSQGRKMDWVGRMERRGSISVGRYGGEEFMVLMPGASDSQARDAVERIRGAILAEPFIVGDENVRVDFSAGVAQCVPDESIDSMVDRADQALYRAKDAGRGLTLKAA